MPRFTPSTCAALPFSTTLPAALSPAISSSRWSGRLTRTRNRRWVRCTWMTSPACPTSSPAAQITFILSGGSALTMYENNEIDLTGVGINDIDRIRDPNEPLNKEFTESNNLDVQYIGFNTQKAPFNDPKVRQALNMAIDKDLL